MPTLDPVLHHPSRTGPSRDYKAIAAQEPVYRQEAFQMQPKRLPVSMNASLKPRPIARSGGNPDTNLPLFRVPVLVRRSNQRPQESGESAERGNWSLSDPSHNRSQDLSGPSSALPGMSGADMLPGMGAEDPLAAKPITWKTIAAGIAVGAVVYGIMTMRENRKKD